MADLARAREDLGAFAAMVGHPLTAVQAAALTLATRITAILAPRQSGKSRSLALAALHAAFRQPGAVVLIVSAGEEASRRLLGEVRRIAASSPLLRPSLVDEQAGLVTLTNGSEVRSVPASERAVRGWAVDLLLLDEAALVSDEVGVSAALPTVAARPDARIVAASTPWAEGGFFYEWVTAGDSAHVRVHRWSLEDCQWITAEAEAAMRASMSPARAAAELDCLWGADTGALFSRAVLERCAADLSLPPLAELCGPARLLGGVDWGVVSDRSAFSAIARLPVARLNRGADPREPVYIICCAKAWPPGEPLSNVVREVAASPAHFAVLGSEVVGVGAGPTQELFRLVSERPPDAGGGALRRAVVVEEVPWADGDSRFVDVQTGLPVRRLMDEAAKRGFATRRNPVATDAALKAVSYERLLWLADSGRLVIPREGDLVRELAALRVELRPGGGEKIEAGRGRDDLPDSLMIASGPWRDRGRVRCVLGDLAAGPLVETDPGDLDEPTVESGGGLRVHVRPAVQSVNGPELTLPAGVEPVRDRHRRDFRAALLAAQTHDERS